MNITEIKSFDRNVAAAQRDLSIASRRRVYVLEDLHYAVGDRYDHRGEFWAMTSTETLAAAEARGLTSRLEDYRAAADEVAAALEILDGLRAEFDAAGGWPRYYLVENTGGHIHSSTKCSTCRPTTDFSWLLDMSGETEEAAVAAHGALLCSVCFPTAPVEWTNHWEVEAAKKAAEYCSGSGTSNWGRVPDTRKVYPSGTCGECGKVTAPTSKYSRTIRKHKPATK